MFPTIRSTSINVLHPGNSGKYNTRQSGIDTPEAVQNENSNDSEGNDEQRHENQSRALFMLSNQSPLVQQSSFTGHCEQSFHRSVTGNESSSDIDVSCQDEDSSIKMMPKHSRESDVFREVLIAFFVVVILFVAIWISA